MILEPFRKTFNDDHKASTDRKRHNMTRKDNMDRFVKKPVEYFLIIHTPYSDIIFFMRTGHIYAHIETPWHSQGATVLLILFMGSQLLSFQETIPSQTLVLIIFFILIQIIIKHVIHTTNGWSVKNRSPTTTMKQNPQTYTNKSSNCKRILYKEYYYYSMFPTL